MEWTLDSKKNVICRYRNFQTGNISDAMDALGLRESAIIGLNNCGPIKGSAVGFAYTVKNIRRQDPYDGKMKARHGEASDHLAQEGDIIVISTNGYCGCSVGGSIQMMRAQSRGICGLLTDGGLRDVGEIATLDYPVYFSKGTPVKSSKYFETVGLQIPVEICGVQIRPNDLVIMDSTGVIVVPEEHIFQVAEETEKIKLREERMISLIKDGVSLQKARTMV